MTHPLIFTFDPGFNWSQLVTSPAAGVKAKCIAAYPKINANYGTRTFRTASVSQLRELRRAAQMLRRRWFKATKAKKKKKGYMVYRHNSILPGVIKAVISSLMS